MTKKITVVLHEPDMPQNTGNIVRLCANAGAGLQLIGPYGFAWDDKRLRRAHLDYEEFAEVQHHASWDACRAALQGRTIYAVETGGNRTLYDVAFAPGDVLLYGSESRGLPESVLNDLPAECLITLPMAPGSRSLNLSNAVAIGVYEAWRQLGFLGAVGLETAPREHSFGFFNGNPGQEISTSR